MRLPRLIAAASVVAAIPALAEAQETGDADRGRAYAERICADCHAIGRGDVQVTRPGVVSFKTVANTPGITGRAIAVWLQTSHPTMPNLIIESKDRDDVIAYILSLRDKP
jgi:cytochrome c2